MDSFGVFGGDEFAEDIQGGLDSPAIDSDLVDGVGGDLPFVLGDSLGMAGEFGEASGQDVSNGLFRFGRGRQFFPAFGHLITPARKPLCPSS